MKDTDVVALKLGGLCLICFGLLLLPPVVGWLLSDWVGLGLGLLLDTATLVVLTHLSWRRGPLQGEDQRTERDDDKLKREIERERVRREGKG